MNATTCERPVQKRSVGMSQIVVVEAPETAHSVFGSCIALSLFDPQRKIGAVAHIVLPEAAEEQTTSPGKFADTALPAMLSQLRKRGVSKSRLVAKVCGGAAMFSTSGPIRIGERNIAAVTEQLTREKIRVVGQHVGGTKGRRVTFDSATGDLTVEIAGTPAETV